MTALRPGQSPPPVRMPIRMSSPPPVPPPDSLRQLMPALIAVDAGTTGVRAFAVDGEGRPMGFSYRELTQYFPRPGWVEHDPEEIWTAVQTTLAELGGRLAAEGVFATDPSNASRTLLYDIRTLSWSDELCDLFGVPVGALPEVRPSSGRIGLCDPARAGGLTAPLSGIAGDQQAALFGHACFTPGMTKNTSGTGSFVLINVGPKGPPAAQGLPPTRAWTL